MMVSRGLSNKLMISSRNKVSHLSIALTLVRTTTVANLDSKLLVTTSDLAKHKARNMKLGDAAFNIDEYVAKLVTFMGGHHYIQGQARNRADDDEMDWASLGRVAMGICRRPPTMDFLLGPLSVEKKELKARTKKQTNLNNADVVRPQEVLSL
jgi:non-structural maintenance of chromosomes element 4